jgi:hypothetical protein
MTDKRKKHLEQEKILRELRMSDSEKNFPTLVYRPGKLPHRRETPNGPKLKK